VIAALALSLALWLTAAADTAVGTVSGVVRALPNESPLSGATVAAVGEGRQRIAVTDERGQYTLGDLPPGRTTLRVHRLGYEARSLEVLVAAGQDMGVDVSLRPRPIPLAELRVEGSTRGFADDTASVPRAKIGLLRRRIDETSPGIAELGIGSPGSDTPGEPHDPSGVLYVRGSSERKLVLFDGAPVYTPFHLAGLLEPFETDLLGSVDLFLGGAPARYNGGLSYIMDISTRAGRRGRLRSSGRVDPMAASVSVEGDAADRFSYLIGGRAVHGLGMGPFVDGSFPYGYRDGLVRLDAQVGGGGAIHLTGFRNRERVLLDSVGAASADASWANQALSLRYSGRIGGADATILAARSGFTSELPASIDGAESNRGEIDQVRLAADLSRRAGPFTVGYGSSFDRIILSRDVRPAAEDRPGTNPKASAQSGGAYVEALWRPVPSLRFRGGVRGDVFLFGDQELRLSPRLAATWSLGERTAMTLALGRYHQLVTLASPLHGEGGDSGYVRPGFAVGGASHTTLSLSQRLDDQMQLGLEGYFKTFGDVDSSVREISQASGVDIWVRRMTGRVQGWAGYSLAWAWTRPADEEDTDRFAGSHLLNVGGTAAVGEAGELSLRFMYGGGLPFTPLPVHALQDSGPSVVSTGPEYNGGMPVPDLSHPNESYLRLDLTAARTLSRSRGDGSSSEITLYLQVLNAFGRRQSLFYFSDGEPHSARPLASVPILPIVGLRWSF
jgi:hypothetical protein